MLRRAIRPLLGPKRAIAGAVRGQLDPPHFVYEICRTAANPRFCSDLASGLRTNGIVNAVAAHDSAALYDWLIRQFAYQGVADKAAETFIERHGICTFAGLSPQFNRRTALPCPKLSSFAAYSACRYKRSAHTCSHPEHLARCPVPLAGGRKGILSEAAVSLFLFMRDAAKNDLVTFIDDQLRAVDYPGHPDLVARQREALVAQFRRIRGVSDKVIMMTFANLLLGGDQDRPTWISVGASMIAIDTLIHNFLIRAGILAQAGTPHAYGAGCYRPGGCAEVLDRIARCIDARAFNRSFPAYFPRFIQHAVWAFCAESGWSICNGRSIDDRERCQQQACPVFTRCPRMALRDAAP